jgi:AAA15 family ATPase/GTPase
MAEKIRYTEILLPSEEPFSNYLVTKSQEIAPLSLSLVNIFMGANNCGKSRLLRSLFCLEKFLHNTNYYSGNDFYSLFVDFSKEYEKLFTYGYSGQVEGITPQWINAIVQDDQHKYLINPDNPIYAVIDKILKQLSFIDSNSVLINTNICPNATRGNANNIKSICHKFKQKLANIEAKQNLDNEKRYYIPTLRGMRPLNLDDQHTDLYADRTIKDYFKKESLSEKMQIFTGLELYQSLKEKLLGEPKERLLVKEFEDFLSIKFFENKPVTLIPKEKSPKVINIKIGDEDQYPIYELGDGLQNLIICTFNIVTEKQRCLFFIEEPDMFMHPSMQRSFLEVLSEYDQHQYFITSHSNHFLDMTIDFANISVFHFSKHEDTQPQFHIRPSSPHDRQILLDLGVRNSSVFITNATIWVEGITDRLYLKAYMKKYIDELELSEPEKYSELIKLKEDYHYSFVEYQGGNLTHWSFDPDQDDDEYKIRAKSICGHAFLIADGDIGSHLKGDRKAVYEKMLGENFYALEVKEIENLIPVEILQKVVKRFKKFQEYGGDINLIEYQKYANLETSIGKYLDEILTLPAETNLFADRYGTLTSYYKGKFCDYAVEIMKDKDSEWSLSPVLKCICNKIFTHIINQNKNS